MHLLISNDDGITAKGIQCLANSLKGIYKITVVAPDRNYSGSSNSLTLDRPLYPEFMDDNHIMLNGTPADCVHLATTGLLDSMPDRVISGINRGVNMGDDVLYSGTVGAATEGRFLHLPAIAVSLMGDKHYETAAAVIKTLLVTKIFDDLPSNTVININVPDVPIAHIRGMQLTHLGSRYKSNNVTTGIDPRGRKHYWIGAAGPDNYNDKGTDFYALANGFVSITPLQIDMTAHSCIDKKHADELAKISLLE